jgi:hypothetical protein
MHRYHCLYMDHGGHVFGGDFFDAAGDSEAVAHAVTVFGNGIGKGFELWRDDCVRVHTYVHPPDGLTWHPVTGEARAADEPLSA